MEPRPTPAPSKSSSFVLAEEALAECAREPIHIPGGIQSFGALLALDEQGRVGQCSANVADFLQLTPEQVLGQPLESVLGQANFSRIQRCFRNLRPGIFEDLGDADRPLPEGTRVLVHIHDDVRILEIVPAGQGLPRQPERDSGDLLYSLGQAAAAVKSQSPVDLFCAKLAQQVRTVTGYDRVLIYQFDRYDDGEVIAEARGEQLEPFLGLHYPASDIPPQARRLYLLNPVRALADASADPVPLSPTLHPDTGRPLDLSFAFLRALSPVHRQYLANMEVRATLTASIVLEDRLWGMLVCHHRTPYLPAAGTVPFLHGMAELIASHVALIESREWTAGMLAAQKLLQKLPDLMDEHRDWAAVLVSPEASLMEAMEAQGLVVVRGVHVFRRGQAPADAEVFEILQWLEDTQLSFLVTDRLGHEESRFAALATVASGMVAMRVPQTDRDWVFWFRPAAHTTVRWGGDPRKGLTTTPAGTRLTPRASFEAWVESVEDRSLPWSGVEQGIASAAVRTSLLDIVTSWQKRQILGLQRFHGILFEQIQDAVVVADLGGRFTFWNAAARQLFGEVPANGIPLAVVAHLADQDHYLSEHQVLTRNGQTHSIDVRGQRLVDGDGKRVGYVLVGRDVTERLHGQEKLRESELRFQTLAASAPVGIYRGDAEGRCIYVNQRWCQIAQVKPEDALGTGWIHIVHPDDLERVAATWRRNLEAQQEFHLEYRYLTPTGKIVWVLSLAVPTFDEDGVLTGYIGHVTDITDLKNYEEMLRESEERFRLIFASAAVGIARVSMDGRFLEVNETWCRITGYSQEELLVKHLREITHPQDQHLGSTEMQELATGAKQSTTLETRYSRKDGSLVWVNLAVSVSRHSDGSPSYFVCAIHDLTERKRMELSLRLSEERFRLVSLATNDAVWDWNIEAQVLWGNENYQNLYGLQPDWAEQELEGWKARIHPEDRERVVAAMRADIHGQGQRRVDEYRFRRVDGSYAHVLSQGFVIRDSEGRPVRMIGAMTDITDRKRVEEEIRRLNADLERRVEERTKDLLRQEEALRVSDERFRLVAETIQDVFWMMRPGSSEGPPEVVYVNPAFETLWGFSREELYENARSVMARVHPEDRPRVEDQICHADRVGFEMEYRVLGPEGKTRWIRHRGHPARDPGGELLFVTGTASDITARKLAEEAVREGEQHARLAAEVGIEIGNCTHSSDLLQRCAQALVSHLGVSAACLWTVGEEGGELLLQASAGEARAPQTPTRASLGQFLVGQVAQSRTPLLVQDPRPEDLCIQFDKMASFAGHPLLLGGRLVGVLTLYSRQPLQEDLLPTLGVVANQIAVGLERIRTDHELRQHSRQLAEANAALARGARLKDEFLASMSHELRTPLNAVLSLSEALQEGVYGKPNLEQAAAARDIEQSGRHLLVLINDILDLSKIEAGELHLQLAPTHVERLCQAAMRLVKEMAQKKRLRTTLSLEADITYIQADERRLKQILVNLLSNATKFTPTGGQIGLEVRGDRQAGSLHFRVWDTGIGIRTQDMGLLFRPFQQIDSRLSREYAGTGLGLVLVKKMAELHGGSVGVESEPGQGSRFTVTLPWVDAVYEPSEDEVAARPRVLLVDDSVDDTTHLRQMFHELGWEAVVQDSPSEARQSARELRASLILVDPLRPGTTGGWDLLQELTQSPDLKGIPVVVASSVDDRPRGLALGACDYLLKPVQKHDLKTMLNRLAGGVAREPAAQPPGGRSPLILMAEDNEVNARSMSDYLSSLGYRVAVAMDGFQVVEMARSLSPQAILMDIQMPGQDGLEATRQLRRDPQTRAIPIVAMTALAMSGDRDRCLQAGADKYLTKPLSLKVLGATLRHMMDPTYPLPEESDQP